MNSPHPDSELPGFNCLACHQEVINNQYMGTANRNHCPHCLASLHVDNTPGDRSSDCLSIMPAVALSFKKKKNKYQPGAVGEIVIVQICQKCHKVNLNRLASDDDDLKILSLADTESSFTSQTIQLLTKHGISYLQTSDKPEILKQLYGYTAPSNLT